MTVTDTAALILAAGLGTRLRPLTDNWPKCLMPIGSLPLLEYWLQTVYSLGIGRALVNTHHHAKVVSHFLQRPRFASWVEEVYEPELLGTAGTLRANIPFLQNKLTLLIHGDNWSQCDFSDFIEFHIFHRPSHCPITMMTFETEDPKGCGIVETDATGVVLDFHEKVEQPPGVIANGAVYLLEPEVLDWLEQNGKVTDFSTGVLVNFLGRIATWKNNMIHRDIGTVKSLQLAQSDPKPDSLWGADSWQHDFEKSKTFKQLTNLLTTNRYSNER